MKSYFMINVFNQIKNRKIETAIIFSITLIMSIFLSLIYFFGYNESMESNIANKLELTYEMKNTHIYSENQQSKLFSNCDDYYDYYTHFVDWIERIGNHKSVAEYHYHHVLTMNVSENDSYKLYGIDSSKFFAEQAIVLIDGRLLTQEEIDSGANLIVVSDEFKIKEDKKLRSPYIGEMIAFGSIDEQTGQFKSEFECKVVGIYDDVSKGNTFSQNNQFNYLHGEIVSDVLLRKYLNEIKNEIQYNQLLIDHIRFNIEDYRDFEKFERYIKDSVVKLDEELSNLGYPPTNLLIDDNNNVEIIHASSRIKYIYQVIFIIVFVVVSLILVASIFYLLKKKTREISVYYSLGQSKSKIILHYFLVYMFIGIFAIMIGLILGYYLSVILTSNLAKDSINVQNELLRFSMVSVMNGIEETAYIPTFSFTLLSGIKICCEILIILGLSVICSITLILKSNILSRNGGWNS